MDSRRLVTLGWSLRGIFSFPHTNPRSIIRSITFLSNHQNKDVIRVQFDHKKRELIEVFSDTIILHPIWRFRASLTPFVIPEIPPGIGLGVVTNN